MWQTAAMLDRAVLVPDNIMPDKEWLLSKCVWNGYNDENNY